MDQNLTALNLKFSTSGKDLLKEVSLEFNSGELQAILGPNGSGKSTLLKVLAGIWMPTSGSVLWNGAPLLKNERAKISSIITLVPQNPQQAFDYLVQDIVAMGRYPHGKQYLNPANQMLVMETLEAVDAIHLAKRKINQISHGERQRVYIARALVTKSPVLLLDEPTASLDIRHQIEIWDLLKAIVKKGKIVIIATHDLKLAKKNCDKVAVIHEGRCFGNGSFSEMMSKELMNSVFGLSEL